MKSSIFNLLIAGGNSALATLLFNGRNTGIYHALRASELPGSLSEAAAAAQGVEPGGILHTEPLLDPPRAGLLTPEPTGPFFGNRKLGKNKGWVVPPDRLTPPHSPHPGLVSPELGAMGGSALLRAASQVLGASLHHPALCFPRWEPYQEVLPSPPSTLPYILPAPSLPGLPPALATTQAASLDLQSPPGPPLPFHRGTTSHFPGLQAQTSPHQPIRGSSTGLSSLQGLT